MPSYQKPREGTHDARRRSGSEASRKLRQLIPPILLDIGRPDEAVAVLERAAALLKDNPGMVGQLRATYAQAGRRTEARRILEQLRQTGTGNLKLTQKFLRHSSVSITADIYTHTLEREAATALERSILGNLFSLVLKMRTENKSTIN